MAKVILFLIVLSTIFGIPSLLRKPETSKPPFNVKVIEDKTRTKELQKEGDSLRNELHEAKMIISALEEGE